MWIYKELEKRLCRCLYILFLTAASFADFCIFSVPPPSLGIVSVPRNWRNIRWLSATYICRFYILRWKADSAWESRIRLTVITRYYKIWHKSFITKQFHTRHIISVNRWWYFFRSFLYVICTFGKTPTLAHAHSMSPTGTHWTPLDC